MTTKGQDNLGTVFPYLDFGGTYVTICFPKLTELYTKGEFCWTTNYIPIKQIKSEADMIKYYLWLILSVSLFFPLLIFMLKK